MGTSMYYSADGGKLFRETLLKIQPYLARTNYRGFIDVNSMVTPTGAYMLEFTTRFGYPQLDIQLDMHKTPWGELLYKVANGTLKNFETAYQYAVGVIIGGAGMPYDISYNKYGRNLPVFGINEKNRRQVKLLQVYKKNRRFYCGTGGYPLTITGCGHTMEDAQKNAYSVVKEIIIPNSVYRIDIGDHWKHEAPLLKKWGYL
jgi:phosphoribosylamine--glycine ligase